MPTFTPVTFDPFADDNASSSQLPSFAKVDFDPFEEIPDAPLQDADLGGFATDFGAGLGVGASNLFGTVGDIYGVMSGDFDNYVSRKGLEGAEYFRQFYTPELTAKQELRSQKIDAADGQLAKLGTAVWETVSDLDLFGNLIAEQAAMSLPGLGAAKGAQLLGAGRLGATVAGGTTGGAVQGASIAGQVKRDLEELPDQIWDTNAEFQSYLSTMGRDEAKDRISTEAARKAFALSGVISLATQGLIPNTLEKTVVGGVAGDGLFTRALKSGLGEGLQETLEEGGGQIAANLNVQPIDASVGTFEGVGEAAGLGLLGGATMGAGFGAAQRKREEVLSQGGDELSAAAASSGVIADEDIESLRARLGVNPQPMSPPLDQGPINLDPIQVDGNSATYSGPTGTFKIEMATAEESLAAARDLQRRTEQQEPVFNDEPIQVTPFEPTLKPQEFETNPNIGLSGLEMPQLPIDLDAEIDRAEESGQSEKAIRLRNAQQLQVAARFTEDRDLAERQLERSSAIIGVELAEEIAQLPPRPLEGDFIPATNFERPQSDLQNVTTGIVEDELPPIQDPGNAAIDMRRVIPQGNLRLPPGNNTVYSGAPQESSDVVYKGSRGTGFATRKGAEAALKSRQNAQPEYSWELFKDQTSGNFMLSGNKRPRIGGVSDPINKYIDQIDQDAAGIPESQRTAGENLREFYELADADGFESQIAEIDALIESREQSMNEVMSENDDIITVIRKLGGLNTEEAVAQGIDPESFRRFVGKNRPIKKNGRSFDDMGEVLSEYMGRETRMTANEVVDLVQEAFSTDALLYPSSVAAELNGYSDEIDYLGSSRDALERDAEIIQELVGSQLTDDEIQFLDETYKEAFNEIYGQQEITISADARTSDVGRNRGSDQSTLGGSPRGQGRDEEAFVSDPPGIRQATQEVTQAEPQGSVLASEPSEFELESYTEQDIARLEGRDLDEMEATSQIDRERDEFSLDSGAATISGASDSMQTEQRGSLFDAPVEQAPAVESTRDPSLPNATPILERVTTLLEKDSLSSADLDSAARAMGVTKKRKGESLAARKSRMIQTLSSLMELNESAQTIRDGKFTVAQRKDLAARTGTKVRGGKQQIGDALLNRLQSLQTGLEDAQVRKATKEKIRALMNAGQPVSVADYDSLAKKGERSGMWLYTQGDRDVAVMLGDEFLLPKGQRENEQAYLDNEAFIDDPKGYLEERVDLDSDAYKAFFESIVKYRDAEVAVRGMNSRFEFEALDLGVPVTEENIADLANEIRQTETYQSRVIEVKAELRAENAAKTPIDLAWENVGEVWKPYTTGEITITPDPEDSRFEKYTVTVSDEFDLPPGIDSRTIGPESGGGIANEIREVARFNDAMPKFRLEGSPRGATRVPTLTDDQLNSVVDRVVGEDRKGFVVLLDSYRSLPENILEAAAQQGSTGRDIGAAFHNGKVYVVKGKMRSESRLEETLLHEGTHGGILDLYQDQGVTRALNRMWVSMGGQSGFDKIAVELGITKSLEIYSSGMKDGRYDEATRNRVMVEEMLAFTGEKGSTGWKQKAREVLGAIRAWLRNNGFLRLSKMTASDVSFVAKTARDRFFSDGQSKQRGETRFAFDKDRKPKKNELGLYSNAEKVLLDEGDKIFKVSKKNPTGSVRGDQILSFLKGRGLKKDEAEYTDIEAFLTGTPGQRFTRDEVITQLRDETVVLEESQSQVVGGFDVEIGQFSWSEAEPETGTEYYEHTWEDINYSLQRDQFSQGDYAVDMTLERTIQDNDEDLAEFILSDDFIETGEEFRKSISMGSPASKVRATIDSVGVDEFWTAAKSKFETEMDDAAWAIAEEIYMEDPYQTVKLLSNDVIDATINGSDDIGWSARIMYPYGDTFRDEVISDVYDLDEIKLQVDQWARENGYAELVDSDVIVYDYFSDIKEEPHEKYREILLTTDGKWGTYPAGESHFDQDNLLYNIISTDRDTELGNAFVIEEMQSDWHSQIRKAGGVRDSSKIADAQRKATAANDERNRLTGNAKILSGRVYDRIENSVGKEAVSDYILNAEIVFQFDDMLTDKGREWINSKRDAKSQEQSINEIRLMPPSIVRQYFKKEALYQIKPSLETVGDKGALDGSYLADMKKVDMGARNYGEVMQIINSAGVMDLSRELFALEAKARELGSEESTLRSAVRVLDRAPVNSPFRDDRYLELGVKRSLIGAIEEGKDALVWSQGDRVQSRWSQRYDYDAQYNRKIAKIVKKLTGQSPVSMNTDGEVDSEATDFWAVPLTDQLKSDITEDGLPMFRREEDGPEVVFPELTVEETLADKWIRIFQDKMVRLKRLQQNLVEVTGEELGQAKDVYLGEEAFYGKVEEDLRQMQIRMLDPFINKLSETKISIDELDEYLVARHAEERNAQVATINEDMPDGGSGMTNQEANEVLAKINASPKRAQFEALAADVYKMTELTRGLMSKHGLVTEEEVSSYRDMYQNYIPLRGFANDEQDSNSNRIPGTPFRGKGFDVRRSKESIRALGRRSRAKSPVAQVIADLTEKTIRGRKNEVGNQLLAMVEAYPDTDQWEVFTDANPDTGRGFLNGKVVNNAPINMRDPAAPYFATKRDGVVHYIKLNDPALLVAMKNLGPEPLGVVTSFIRPFTRFLSAANTSYNPQFIVTNFSRDITAAVSNVLAEETMEDGLIFGESLAAKVAAGALPSVKAIYSASRNEAVNDATDPDVAERRKYYQMFLDDGAKTGYFDSLEVDEIAKRLEKDLQLASPGKINSLKKGFKDVVQWVDQANSAVENGVRLSAYMEAVKAGVPRYKAASLAKNLTVNFNRKGELGAAINSIYMFFNAAVQGPAQWARSVGPITINSKGKPELRKTLNLAQKVAGAGVVGGMAMASLGRFMGGDDDDGVAYWDKIPQMIRERNLVIMKPGTKGEYVKIPLPYGYNIFWNMGDSIEAAMAGSKDRKASLLTGLVSSVSTSFSPFSLRVGENAAASLALSFTPSVAMPITEIAVNQNFFGDRIYPENFPGGAEKADAELYYPSTKDPYVAVAKFMNEVTGGSSRRSGAVDISPETISAVLEYVGGGAYRTATGVVDMAARAVSDREIETANIPFARIVLGKDGSDYADQDKFYERRQSIMNARQEYADGTTSEQRRKSDEGFGGIRRLYPRANNTYKLLKKLRDQSMRIRDNDSLSPAVKDERLLSLRERKDDLVDSFNLAFDTFVERQD
jgi:hypothetical protein